MAATAAWDAATAEAAADADAAAEVPVAAAEAAAEDAATAPLTDPIAADCAMPLNMTLLSCGPHDTFRVCTCLCEKDGQMERGNQNGIVQQPTET